MKIALIGYGRMGKAVAEIAEKSGDEIVLIIDSDDDWQQSGHLLTRADMAIEFTTPQVAPENIRRCFRARIPVVCGTTGWDHLKAEIRQECIITGNSLLVSPNFSLGVNLFFLLNRYLANLMNRIEYYEVSIHETHHIHKRDAPSGTAIRLAEDLIQLLDRKNQWTTEPHPRSDQICVISHRTGEVPGIHMVKYSSDEDELVIQHSAKGRQGFARGALLAARWLKGKSGFFTMDDLVRNVLEISD